jgi:putative transposase
MSDKISIIHRSLKIRLYPDKNQKILLNKTFGCCRLLYNERLAEHIEWYNANKGLPKDQRSKFKGKLPKQLREEKYEFLSDAIAEPLIQSQRNCEQAFSNFFKSITKQRKGKKVGFPKFKSKKQHRDSFSIYMLPKNCLDWEHRLVAIPKLKQVKFRHAEDKSKKWIGWFKEATIRSMTISRNACEEYWCSILFEREQDIYSTICPIKAIGLDFSPNSLYINDLNEVAPGFRKAKQENKKKLTRLQRNLMKKQKDSKNREKARIKLAQFENHIANIRRDYREKETLRLVRTYDIIGIEDLNLQGMMKFSHNAKNYVDCSWYSFVTRLEQKAKSNNCLIIKSDRFYPSSKTCNHCGYVNKNLKLSDRTWICPKCEAEIIRDQNAALNLKENALKILLEEIKSSLLLEQQEVMSMEDMEINLCNSEICGVSVEVENQSGDALKKKLFSL